MQYRQVPIRQVDDGQSTEIACVLAEAFTDEAIMAYELPNRRHRATWFPVHFHAFVRAGQLFGRVYVAGDIEGASVWFPPGRAHLSVPEQEEAGLACLPRVLPPGAFARFQGVMDHLRLFHDRVVPEPHWYLALIGVSPNRQSRGVGGALLGPVLREADEHGLRCFLETVEPRTVAFYSRYGFCVAAHDREPESGIQFWSMVREPERSRH